MEPDHVGRLFEPEVQKENESENLFRDGKNAPREIKLKSDVTAGTWKVLLVDDEEDIHSVTLIALKGFNYKGREIQFIHAYSAEEAKQSLVKHRDIALIFLDVVMETNHAGLDLVKYIREVMRNHFTQIVLRTGYPGQAPEREVIVMYEINDYKTKTELTTFKLFTVTLASLRAFDSISQLDNLRKNLEKTVTERTAELERKNMKIMEMDQMKTRFFANVSHEFRTPLTLIISPLEDLLVDKEIPAYKKDVLEMMQRNAVRLLGLINQLLDLSKIDAGSMKLNLMHYDITKVIKQIARSFIPLAERKTIKYNIKIPDENLMCFFDRDKIEKIMVNLLSNAFKYTPEKGEIAVSVTCSEETGKMDTRQVELKVRDTGVGIPSVLLEKIFDRFYQVEDGWKKGTGGTGIGLSLTKELTDLQHGEIQVESEPGKGSCFSVTLPVGKDHLEKNEYIISEPRESDGESMIIKYSLSLDHKPENAMVAETEQGSDRPVILIADDNTDIRQHIRESLAGEFIIKEAENGRAALEMAINLIPDLVISDLMMPEMNGLELCGKLKTDIRISHIPVIMLTAKAEIQNKLEGLETGADDYMVKPFNNRELILRVKNLIEQRKKLRAKYSKDVLLDTGEKTVKSMDEKFLERVRKIIEKNISDSSFDVNSFYPEMGMSRMQLFRKLKALVNQTPGELIRNLRLQRAAQLIKQNYGNIAEVTFEVGFNNLSYFSNCFREKYGLLPSEYQKQFATG